MSKLITARVLATHLSVRPATVLAWARRGWIPCLRAGQRPVLFDPVAVEQALRDRAKHIEVTRA
jgi:phage terminase Nu1 subunit (DNA packaging protein)